MQKLQKKILKCKKNKENKPPINVSGDIFKEYIPVTLMSKTLIALKEKKIAVNTAVI